jgi:hypothetical protein
LKPYFADKIFFFDVLIAAAGICGYKVRPRGYDHLHSVALGDEKLIIIT